MKVTFMENLGKWYDGEENELFGKKNESVLSDLRLLYYIKENNIEVNLCNNWIDMYFTGVDDAIKYIIYYDYSN